MEDDIDNDDEGMYNSSMYLWTTDIKALRAVADLAVVLVKLRSLTTEEIQSILNEFKDEVVVNKVYDAAARVHHIAIEIELLMSERMKGDGPIH